MSKKNTLEVEIEVEVEVEPTPAEAQQAALYDAWLSAAHHFATGGITRSELESAKAAFEASLETAPDESA